jgi:hypothetical protein
VQREPYLDEYSSMQDSIVDQFSDTIFFMLPTHIISYIYGGQDVGVHNVTFAIKQHETTNSLQVVLEDPPSL